MVSKRAWRIFVIVLAVSLVCGFAVAQEQKEFEPGSDTNLEWAKNYDEAASTAKTKYMPVLIYFYGREDSDLCKLAETDIFKKASVKTQAKKFACVKVAGATKEGEELCKKYSVSPPGAFAIVLLDYQLTEKQKIREEKELKKLETILKDVAGENKKSSELVKKIEKAFEQAMDSRKKGEMRNCVAILEEIVTFKGKVDSKYIGESEKILEDLAKQGGEVISQAEQEIAEVENSLRWGSAQNFRSDLANSAQQKLMRVSRDFPVQALKNRLLQAQTRLAQANAEYQRQLQEEQKKNSP